MSDAAGNNLATIDRAIREAGWTWMLESRDGYDGYDAEVHDSPLLIGEGEGDTPATALEAAYRDAVKFTSARRTRATHTGSAQ